MDKHPDSENPGGDIREHGFHFNQASFARSIRNYKILQARFMGVISTGIGLGYFILGIVWLSVIFSVPAADTDISVVAGLVLPAFCWPLVTIAGFGLSYLFAPRCPHCRRRFYQPSIQLASGFCLHCRKELFENLSLYGFQLKPHNPLYNFPVLYSYLFRSYAVFIILGYAAVLYFKTPAVFAVVLVLEGILSGLFPLFVDTRWNLRRKKHSHGSCKVCREYPQLTIFTYTGNCSECGSPGSPDWPPPESDSIASLPAWDEVARQAGKYHKIAFFIIASIVLLLLSGFTVVLWELLPPPHGWLLLLSGAAASVIFLFAVPAWRQARFESNRTGESPVFFGCPYCNEYFRENKNIKARRTAHSAHYHCLKHYERCSLCCRILIKRLPAAAHESP